MKWKRIIIDAAFAVLLVITILVVGFVAIFIVAVLYDKSGFD